MKKLMYLLIFALFAINNAIAQSLWIYEGKVVLGEDIPLCNVEIRSKISKKASFSDSLGNFKIEVANKDKIVIRTKPFVPKSLVVDSNNPPNNIIKLDLIDSKSNVEVAVGYGYISDKMLTDAVQYVEAKKSFSNYLDIWQIIQEKFNNVVIHNGCVVVRGPSSINGDNCAMFVVDGHTTQFVDHISPSDIKEISLLKGSGATIYGSRGANGVFLINTIKGCD